MTNHWIDIKNSDCILIMGSNAAENHPVSFKYVTEAHGKRSHADQCGPSVHADISKSRHLRCVTVGHGHRLSGRHDQVYFGERALQQEYVSLYTNAPFIVGKDYGFEDGIFSGYQKKGAHSGKIRQAPVGV
jgi:formate dehydrogenase major subunit